MVFRENQFSLIEKVFGKSYSLDKSLSENRFSGKTYFYTIASIQAVNEGDVDYMLAEMERLGHDL